MVVKLTIKAQTQLLRLVTTTEIICLRIIGLSCKNSRCCDWRGILSKYNSIFIEEIPNADRRIVYVKNKYGELIYGVDLRDMRLGREINLIPLQLIPEADLDRVRRARRSSLITV